MLVGETLVHPVTDGTVVVQRGKHLLDLVQHILDAHNIEKGLLLARKRGVGQVFGRCRGTHRERHMRRRFTQGCERVADRLFKVGRERLGFHQRPDPRARARQRAHVVDVQRVQ